MGDDRDRVPNSADPSSSIIGSGEHRDYGATENGIYSYIGDNDRRVECLGGHLVYRQSMKCNMHEK